MRSNLLPAPMDGSKGWRDLSRWSNYLNSMMLSWLFTPFSPHIHSLCIPIFEEWVGCATVSKEAGWDFSDSDTLFQQIRRHVWSKIDQNFYIAMAIVLGAVYGICSRACYENSSSLKNYTGIAFNPMSTNADYSKDGQNPLVMHDRAR